MQITAGSTFKDLSVSFPGQKWPFGLQYPWGIERHYTDHPRGHEAAGDIWWPVSGWPELILSARV